MSACFWRRQWHPTPVLLPGKSHGWRSLEGCSPWGRWGLDTTERLHFHFLLSFIGEGNGNPLQCSCLENPRDGGAWWAASMGSCRVEHDWSDLAAACFRMQICTFRMCMYDYCESNFLTFCFFSGCVSKIHVSRLSRYYSSSQPDGLTAIFGVAEVSSNPSWVWVPAKQNDSSCRSCMQSELKN